MVFKERSVGYCFAKELDQGNKKKKKMNEQNQSRLNILFNRCPNLHIYVSLKGN